MTLTRKMFIVNLATIESINKWLEGKYVLGHEFQKTAEGDLVVQYDYLGDMKE